jgi:peroxiredoxin
MAPGQKLQAGAEFPSLSVAKVGGGELEVGGSGRWRMLVVYRGKHCPICRRYLKTLDGLLDDYTSADVDVLVVSADSKEKAEAQVAEEGWRFPTGYGLTTEQMSKLGLYISNPLGPEETDRPFAEPGLFIVNPEGRAQVIDISNAPFTRPDLSQVLVGLKGAREKKRPPRGTAG